MKRLISPNVLITGVDGYIGSCLINYLQKKYYLNSSRLN